MGGRSPFKTIEDQYKTLKKECQGAILLFRTGDFYEAFYEDAKLLSPLLGLSITKGVRGESEIEMVGFPSHHLEGYLRRLIGPKTKYRVAVCEQAVVAHPGMAPVVTEFVEGDKNAD